MKDAVNVAYKNLLSEYPDVLGIDEMSLALNISNKTAYKLLRNGTVKGIKAGRAYKIPKAKILEFLLQINE